MYLLCMAKKKKKSKITLNVQIPITLHEQFKAYAQTQGEPMRFFVQRAIKAMLPVQVKTATLLNPATGETREITLQNTTAND